MHDAVYERHEPGQSATRERATHATREPPPSHTRAKRAGSGTQKPSLVSSLMIGWVQGRKGLSRSALSKGMISLGKKRGQGAARKVSIPAVVVLLSPEKRRTHADIAGDEELLLIARYQQGDQKAGETLILAHEGLILQYAMRGRYRGLDDEDLFQEARIGFLKGVLRYRPTHGARLPTYARWWMIAAIEDAILEGGSLVYCPATARTRVRQARALGVDTPDGMAEAGLLRRANAERALAAVEPMLSLDVTVSSDTDETFVDTLVDTAPCVDERYEEADEEKRAKEAVDKLLEALTDRERAIILGRFARKPETLLRLGHRFDVTRERIRQIQAVAMKKLRAAAEAAGLVDAFREPEDDRKTPLLVIEGGGRPAGHTEEDPLPSAG